MGFTWNNSLTKVTSSVYTELRSNIDTTVDNIIPSCSSVNSTVNSTVNSSVCSSQNSTYCSGVNASNLTANYSGQNSTYCSGVNSTNRTTNYDTQNASVNASYRNAVYSTVNNEVYGQANGTSANTTVNSGYRSYVYTSDVNLKNIDSKILDPLDKIKHLNGYLYRGNEEAIRLGLIDGNLQIGVSAQEVQEVMPELVVENFENKGYLAVDYAGLIPLLIEGLKEQQKQINDLFAQVSDKINNEVK